VVSFGATGIDEVGQYIAEGGNNFWGVEQFAPATKLAGNVEGTRLIAASDRDYGSSSSAAPADRRPRPPLSAAPRRAGGRRTGYDGRFGATR
jgi:hypothetical protein